MADPSGLTATNLTVGTVAYAAPEQLMGEDIDGRADEYALAATVFHLLTGAPPYHHSNPVAVISQHLNAPPPRLSSLRPGLALLDDVFSTALAKNPADRFGQCHEFATALSERAGSGDRFGVDRTGSATVTGNGSFATAGVGDNNTATIIGNGSTATATCGNHNSAESHRQHQRGRRGGLGNDNNDNNDNTATVDGDGSRAVAGPGTGTQPRQSIPHVDVPSVDVRSGWPGSSPRSSPLATARHPRE